MGKLVIFKLGDGSFAQGFPVTLQISEVERHPFIETVGKLPAMPEILQSYQYWQSKYYELGGDFRITAPKAQITNISVTEDCNLAAKEVRDRLNQWLRSHSFLPIRESLIEHIKRDDEVRILIQTQDIDLQRLPWHLCDLFERYRKSEVMLSIPSMCPPTTLAKRNKIRILAILGSSEGIDVKADQELLQQLPNAEISVLVEPLRQQLNDELWKQGWDVIFFAGHSSSQDCNGRIYINQAESITIEQLRYGLQSAVEGGLRLAIFNSCDGLELARSLFALHIPQTIVMREPVPDLVAQSFLKYFLADFAQGTSFYLSVRRAREKLQGLEDMCPCATWLPVIVQNPLEQSLSWPKKPEAAIQPQKYRGCIIGSLWAGSSILLGLFFVSVLSGKLPFSPFPSNSTNPIPENASNRTLPLSASNPLSDVSNRISLGTQILIKANNNPDKQAGGEAFAKGDYNTAIAKFQISLQNANNDPEALIYLNNARAAKAGRILRIAVSVPIGGNLNIAQEMLRGVAQAQDEINSKGGINGALLQVEIANDDNNPEIAKQIAATLIADPLILGVVGHNASEVSLAVAPTYQKGELVMISPTSSAVELSNAGTYIFRTAPSNSIDAQNIARYAVNIAHRRKLAICIDSRSPFSTSIHKELQISLQRYNTQLSSIECDFANSAFNPITITEQMLSSGVDGLVLAPSVERINQAIAVAKAAKNRIDLYGASTMNTFETLKLGQEDVLNMVVAVVWHPKSQSQNSFAEKAQKLWGGSINWRSAMSYDATRAFIHALQKNSTRSGLQITLSDPNFTADGATGTVQFLPSGDRKRSLDNDILVRIQADLNNPTGYNFFPLN